MYQFILCLGDAGVGVGGGGGFWGMKLYIFCEIENNLDLAFSQVVAIHMMLSLLFNHSKASLSFKVPFYEICWHLTFTIHSIRRGNIAAILLRKYLTLAFSRDLY